MQLYMERHDEAVEKKRLFLLHLLIAVGQLITLDSRLLSTIIVDQLASISPCGYVQNDWL